jgi:SAM-dependent methyltransferase
MRAPAVDQSRPLSDLFAEALTIRRPASVAILGIAGGNGLERFDPSSADANAVQRVVGIDINPAYLDAVRQRFAQLPGLELLCADLASETVELAPVELVHAALIFEHAGTGRALDNAVSLVSPGGALSVVLQLPGDPAQNIGNSGFASVQSHSEHFALVDPAWFTEAMHHRGFVLAHEARRAVPAGKTLWLATFTRS